jgi:hypothetical protein
VINLKKRKMKRVLTKFLTISSIGLLMLSSCKKNDAVVKNVGSTTSSLTTSATTLVLDKTRLTDTTAAISFSFTAPTYTYKAVVSNSLEIDAAGDNWKNPTTAALGGKAASQGYSTATFNALLLKLNLPAGVASKINVRVVNALSPDVATYSNVLSLTVTPFNLTSFLYVVGAFQTPSMWNAASPDSLISPTSNNIYTGVIYFTAGNNQFLILPQKISYDNKYATNDPQNTTSATVQQNAPNNFYAPAVAGYYLITLNLNAGTIAFEHVNSYSVIGSVTPGGNYSTDDAMKYVNGNQDWEGVFPLTFGTFPGGFKIRQNDDWTWSWGVLAAPDGVTLADSNDGNIPVPASGNYKVTFTYPTAAYSIAGTPPSVTGTYTVTAQ